MQSFDFCRPTNIVFGAGRVSELSEIVKKYGRKVIFVTYEEKMADILGLRKKILIPFSESGLEVQEHYGVKSNPTVEHTRKILSSARSFQPDVIVAVGGGSVIDECKFISAALHYNGDPWDIACGKARIETVTPVIAVVTMPATSSEMNDTAVISNETLKRKEGFSDVKMVPAEALLDPEFTYDIPLKQTGYSATDIVSHLLEAYIVHQEAFVPMQNRFCEGMIKTVIDCMDRIIENPRDKEARAMLMWTATYAWNGFYVCGLGSGNPAIHILGHSLSAFYDTPHGAAMGITIPAVIRYTMKERTARYARMSRKIFGVDEDDDCRAAHKGLEMLIQWIRKMGSPTTFREAGIPEDNLEALSADALKTAEMWGVGDKYTLEMCKDMFACCL